MKQSTVLWALGLMSLVAAPPAVAQAPAAVEAKPGGPDLAAMRAALKKYEDPYVAVHDGYFSSVGCVEIGKPGAPGHVQYKPGGMGIHFLNLSLVGPVPDPNKPRCCCTSRWGTNSG